MLVIWCKAWRDMNSNELGQPCPYGLPICSPHEISLGLTLHFSSADVYIPDISNFPVSSLYLQLHPQASLTTSQGQPAGSVTLPYTAWTPMGTFEILMEVSMHL
jgi:hypothetical protein